MTSNNKKAKTVDEFDTVKQYLMECPVASKDSRAIQGALRGLQEEQKRMERDEKLLKKFAGTSTTNKKQDTKSETTSSTGGQREKNTLRSEIMMDGEEEEDWQDVGKHGVVHPPTSATSTALEDEDMVLTSHDSDSPLGRQLSQGSIRAMSQAGIAVKDPLSAIALALHGALLQLDFCCTGIPPPKEGNGGGFAPPVRPLSKDQFVPPDWDSHSGDEESPYVALRYRKEKVGAVHLEVKSSINNDSIVLEVQLTPGEHHTDPLEFDLNDHFNQDSFLTASLASEGKKRVLPALHYKALPLLLTKFCNSFDLGPVYDDPDVKLLAAAAASTQPSTQVSFRPASSNPISQNSRDPLRVYNQHENPNIGMFRQPQRAGDFNGDLIPGGLVDPSFGPGVTGGNLMGPNHPTFMGGGVGPPRLGGGMGMKPRFDPYGPPGGPTDPNNPNNFGSDPDDPLANSPKNNKPPRRAPPGGSGNPNPDHELPPSNMFL